MNLRESYEAFDAAQIESLSLILGHRLNDASILQSFLPVKKGGAGLRSAKQHSAAAFIASCSLTRAIVDAILPPHIERRSLQNAFPLLQQATGNPTYTDLGLLSPEATQHSLSSEIDNNTHTQLLDESDIRAKARLRSLTLPHAGDWIDAIPSAALNLNMDSRSFGTAMCYRLGIPFLQQTECPSLLCDYEQDELGDHAMHCNDNNGIRAGRHDRIRDRVNDEAQRASLNPTKEFPGIVPGSLSRPADIYVPDWIDGRKVAFDVSVTSPTQEAVLLRAAETAATAIDARKATKNRAHLENCRAQGIFFQPLVVETFGGWDPVKLVTADYLKKMATKAARRWGKTPAMEIKYFFQRLSIALQRGNAALLIARDFEPISQL